MERIKLPDLQYIEDELSSQKINIKYDIGDKRNGFKVLKKSERKKILLLSDDIRFFTGIGTQGKTLVYSTIHQFNWVNSGPTLDHSQHNKLFNLDEQVTRETGVMDSSLSIYGGADYGNPDKLRRLIELENPDAIMIFTDPRFWVWLFQMEDEIKHKYKLPIIYWNIWDSPPASAWNKPYYQTCDLLLGISKQTYQINRSVLGDNNYYLKTDKFNKIDKPLVEYLPHGIDQNSFFPIDEEYEKYQEYIDFRNNFYEENNVSEDHFMVMWNNRNITRKNPQDVLLAFAKFCEGLPKEKADKCFLYMNTDIIDPNGTDLKVCHDSLCPEANVIFSKKKCSTTELNYLYNMADVVPNISSNEGFGLGTCESIMAGTPVILNVTGGLQDQAGFKNDKGKYLQLEHLNDDFMTNSIGKYKNHGEWASVIFPKVRTMKGHPETPYITYDNVDYNDLATEFNNWYQMSREERKERGKIGREFLLTNGFNMNSIGEQFISITSVLFNKWVTPKRWSVDKIERKIEKTKGINL